MEHRLCCQISEQDGMLRVKDVLEKKMGLTRRQISRLKYIPDGITLNPAPFLCPSCLFFSSFRTLYIIRRK